MKTIVLRESTAENLYRAPEWWTRFSDDITHPDLRTHAKRWYRRREWMQDVNTKLQTHGGRIQPYDKDDTAGYLITFRRDCDYTFFMLKYS